MKLLLSLLAITVASICNAQTGGNEIIFTEADTITGSLYTAGRLRGFMETKEYDQAIALFSSEQQTKIQELREDERIFAYWCAAWTFDQMKFELYISKIKDGKATFIFEDNEWRINEK